MTKVTANTNTRKYLLHTHLCIAADTEPASLLADFVGK